jgi:hypothetical protein
MIIGNIDLDSRCETASRCDRAEVSPVEARRVKCRRKKKRKREGKKEKGKEEAGFITRRSRAATMSISSPRNNMEKVKSPFRRERLRFARMSRPRFNADKAAGVRFVRCLYQPGNYREHASGRVRASDGGPKYFSSAGTLAWNFGATVQI